MNDEGAKVRKLLRQQTAIARFGSFALREDDLQKILTEAARVCAESLSVPYAKVCRYRAAENDLLIEAGHGWKAGVIGTIESADPSSPQGKAFVTGEPSICNDVRKENNFELPRFYAAHGIVSTVDVVIHVKNDAKPYGVLRSTTTDSMITISTISTSSPALPMSWLRPSRPRRGQQPCKTPSRR